MAGSIAETPFTARTQTGQHASERTHDEHTLASWDGGVKLNEGWNMHVCASNYDPLFTICSEMFLLLDAFSDMD